MRSILPVILLLYLSNSFSQEDKQVIFKGYVADRTDSTRIPYVKVYNPFTHSGTLTNYEGYFEIGLSGAKDSVAFTYLGYEPQWQSPGQTGAETIVYLSRKSTLLNEVSVVTEDGSRYARLLHACNYRAKGSGVPSKLYYELKSFVNDDQVELVECFYNGLLLGYDIGSLDLKAGRIALREYGNHLFISTDGSRAITMMKFFAENPYFPGSPLEYGEKKMLSLYNLYLINRYPAESGDTISVVRFVPKDTSGTFFEGKVWMLEEQERILRMELQCDNAGIHPFWPTFGNKIERVDFSISRSFSVSDGKPQFEQVDFDYSVSYRSRSDSVYAINTRAVLYAYAPGQSFTLPFFEFSDQEVNDYRKINALPYNADFWDRQKEFKLTERLHSNDAFFHDTASLTNLKIFKPFGPLTKGLLKHPYVTWSTNRIALSEMTIDTTILMDNSTNVRSELYNLSVKIFLDINVFGDSLYILTSTILDPYETYYYLTVDKKALCFINLYFDLVECERRKLEEQLLKARTESEAIACYANCQAALNELNATFFKEVERGTIEKKMWEWNQRAYKITGIDNLSFFQPFSE